jgi:hypothetical protein
VIQVSTLNADSHDRGVPHHFSGLNLLSKRLGGVLDESKSPITAPPPVSEWLPMGGKTSPMDKVDH